MSSELYTFFFLFLLLTGVFFLLCNFLLASLLQLISLGKHQKVKVSSPFQSVSVIVPCYNEEENICNKIDNLLHALQHVEIEAEVLFGSDGSTDRTVEIAKERIAEIGNPLWKILVFDNAGKCSTINKLVELARGEIVVSTDADIMTNPDVIDLTVNAFNANAEVGCLSCIPYIDVHDVGSQKYYWNIENAIRKAESKLGSLIVTTGHFYAYRRELFPRIPKGVMADDLWIPLNILLKGYQCVQVEGLNVPYEKTDEGTEILRRKRVIIGGMDVVRRLRAKLVANPWLLFLVFFHKINRWAMPLWVILILVASVGLWPWFLACYAIGAGVLYLNLGRRFFSLLFAMFSPILAFGEVIGKNDFSRWEHTRKQ